MPYVVPALSVPSPFLSKRDMVSHTCQNVPNVSHSFCAAATEGGFALLRYASARAHARAAQPFAEHVAGSSSLPIREGAVEQPTAGAKITWLL